MFTAGNSGHTNGMFSCNPKHSDGISSRKSGLVSHSVGMSSCKSRLVSHSDVVSSCKSGLVSHADGMSFQKAVLVLHSDGTSPRYSASTSRADPAVQSDLIAFLSIVQKCNVNYLSITWQPGLDTLGAGGSGMISQSIFMALAFKRFHESENCDFGFLPMMSEVLILSQPPIQNHPNIVDLEGICWEIKPRTEKAVPVLIFEKASWDLQQFMNVRESMGLVFEDRLKICDDIGDAIVALHAYGMSIYASVAVQV